MNDEIKINYYAIIPSTVRYDKHLKPAEKLLYGEITALANKYGYCYAQNKYFAELYNVTNSTVSRWLSHLQSLGYIKIEIKRNEKQEIIARYIFIIDNPYMQKNQYPYVQNSQYPIDKNSKDNNINFNKEDLFNLIINNSSKIPYEFYLIYKKLEFNYTKEMLKLMQPNKIEELKDIIYVLYDLYNSKFGSLLYKISRESLLNLYTISKENEPSDLLSYYKRVIINKYTNSTI